MRTTTHHSLKSRVLGVLGAMMCVLTFTATTTARANTLTDYLRDRLYDLGDLVRFKISAPRGLKSIGFQVRATAVAQAGLLYHDGKSLGVDRRAIGVWDETRFAYGLSLFSWTEIWRERSHGNRFADSEDVWARFKPRGLTRSERIHWDDGRDHPMSLGAEIQTGIAPGIDVGVYPMEALDLAFGLFMIDMSDDDLMSVEEHYLRKAEPMPETDKSPTPETVAPEGLDGGDLSGASEPDPDKVGEIIKKSIQPEAAPTPEALAMPSEGPAPSD